MIFALSLASPRFSNYTSLLLGRGGFKEHHDFLIRPMELVYSSLPAENYTVCWFETGRCVTGNLRQWQFWPEPPCFKKKRHNNSCVNLFPVLIIYNTSSYTPKWQVQRGSLNLPLWGVPSICSLLKYGTVQKYSYSSRHVCLVLSCCRCAHADKVLLVPASGKAPSTLA